MTDNALSTPSYPIVTLGLDIGKSFIGGALVDDTGKPILSIVRGFSPSEESKTQAPLNRIRGEARRGRSHKKNRFDRRKSIIKMLISNGLLDPEKIADYRSAKVDALPVSKRKRKFYIKAATLLFRTDVKNNNILALRVKALDHLINQTEFAKILYSFSNHRGVSYDDIKQKKNSKEDEKKGFKEALKRYKTEFIEGNRDEFRTLGEFLFKNYQNKFRNTTVKTYNKKLKVWEKNKESKENFLLVIQRTHIKEEVEAIFESQRRLGNTFASKSFEEEYVAALITDAESPDYDHLVSFCPYEKDKRVAGKHHFVSALYIAIEKLYNLRYKDESDEKEYKALTPSQILEILNASFKLSTGISYKKIESILGVNIIEFKGLEDITKDKKPPREKALFDFGTFIKLRKALGLDFDVMEDFWREDGHIHTTLRDMVNIIAYKPTYTAKKEAIEGIDFIKKLESSKQQAVIESVLDVTAKGHLSYSYEVVKRMVEYMLNGFIPHEAKEKVKEEYPAKQIIRTPYLPPVLETDYVLPNNHATTRILSQVRVVVNDILKEGRRIFNNPHWTFDKVVIELAREANSKKVKDKINTIQRENEAKNEEARALCLKYGYTYPNREQLLKAKLFIMQKGIDLYAWAKCETFNDNDMEQCEESRIEPSRLYDEGYCEIEHTLPIMRSNDDSESNKTLVLTKTNRDKKDRTPHEWLDAKSFERMKEYIKRKEIYLSLGRDRVRKMLMVDFKGIDGFKQRDIVNTQIVSKYAGMYIRDHLKFRKNDNFKGTERVFSNNGKITSILRRAWGIGGKNRNTHLHHAEDAILIACSSRSIIKRLHTFIGAQAELSSGLITKDRFDYVLKNLPVEVRDYILQSLNEQGVNIDGLSLKTEKEREAFASMLYHIIAKKSYPYEGFKEDFKATIEKCPVTFFVREKKNGSIHKEKVRKMKELTNDDAVFLRGGWANNDEFLRYDVFKIEGDGGKTRFYFERITPKHTGVSIDKLPVPVISELESATFLFSLYENTAIEIKYKNKGAVSLFSMEESVKGRFWKFENGSISGSIKVKDPKNIADDNFEKYVSSISFDYIASDDLNLSSLIEEESLKKLRGRMRNGAATPKNMAKKITERISDINKILSHHAQPYFFFDNPSLQMSKDTVNLLVSQGLLSKKA